MGKPTLSEQRAAHRARMDAQPKPPKGKIVAIMPATGPLAGSFWVRSLRAHAIVHGPEAGGTFFEVIHPMPLLAHSQQQAEEMKGGLERMHGIVG